MQAGLVEHHDEKDSQQNPNDSQRPASVHQQAQRIPTVNITEATRSINQPPRRTHPQRPPCWQCVQPNPKPYRQPCGFLFILVILFPDHSFPCDASIPMVCGGGEPDTKLMETAKHTASESKTNHSGKLHGIASWPVPKFRSQRIQPWMVRNGSRTSCFIILSHMHGKYFRLTQHTPSFPDSTQAVSLYAEYIHIRIHALTHHSWLYSGDASIPDKCLPETSRQQWNDDFHAEDTER